MFYIYYDVAYLDVATLDMAKSKVLMTQQNINYRVHRDNIGIYFLRLICKSGKPLKLFQWYENTKAFVRFSLTGISCHIVVSYLNH